MSDEESLSTDDKVNILVVDDVPDKLISMQVVLHDLGENVIAVTSGREALRQLLDRDFAVILLDVNMPDMDGFETAHLIRQRKRSEHTPIIFITAFSDDTHALQGYSLGAVDYILAPVVPDVLRTKVAVFVDLFRKGQQIQRQADQRVALANEQAARAAAEAATRRSTFLAAASEKLSMSLDYDSTINTLLEHASSIAGCSAVGIIQRYDPDGRVKSATRERPGKDVHVALQWSEVPAAVRQQIDTVVRARKTCTIPWPNGSSGGGNPSWLLQTPAGSSVTIVPLAARGRILGVLCLSHADGDRALAAVELSTAEDLAGRAAVAIDNARLYREIQDGDRRKDEFLAMLGHELRNPLAAIGSALECLRFPDNDEQASDVAHDVLERQVNQMTRLVDDLLDVSRITRGKVELRKEVVELQSAIARAVATTSPVIASRRHELHTAMPEQPIRVYADPVRLEQIFANLLNNAAKYTQPGGKISFGCQLDKGNVVLRVRDTGMGIPPQLLPKIFDLFTQGDRSLDRSQGGLGIGLTLVKRLVDMHGGHVEALSSGNGQGSEFVVRLPCLSDQESSRVTSDEVADVSSESVERRILLVDDNADLTATMAAILTKLGHEVRTAGDGPAAIDLAAQFQPEFILVDIGLPGMNGYEVAQFLRTQPGMTEVMLVAMTGYGQAQDRQRSKEAGFDDHLVKPVPIRAIQELLATPRQRRRGSVPCATTAGE